MYANNIALMVDGGGTKLGGSGGKGPINRGPTDKRMNKVQPDHKRATMKEARVSLNLTSLISTRIYTTPAITASQLYSIGIRIIITLVSSYDFG